jgi:hypothetical protein
MHPSIIDTQELIGMIEVHTGDVVAAAVGVGEHGPRSVVWQ